jgi:voltage-gated sodium channel
MSGRSRGITTANGAASPSGRNKIGSDVLCTSENPLDASRRSLTPQVYVSPGVVLPGRNKMDSKHPSPEPTSDSDPGPTQILGRPQQRARGPKSREPYTSSDVVSCDSPENSPGAAMVTKVDEGQLRRIFREELQFLLAGLSQRGVVPNPYDLPQEPPAKAPTRRQSPELVAVCEEVLPSGPVTERSASMPIKAARADESVEPTKEEEEKLPGNKKRDCERKEKDWDVYTPCMTPASVSNKQMYGGALDSEFGAVNEIEDALRHSGCARWAQIVDYLYKQREPKRDSCLANVVINSRFEVVVAVVIALNAVFQVYCTNWKISNIGQPQPRVVAWGEAFFLIAYFVELAVKLIVHRLYFFWNDDMAWNIFDFMLVVVSMYDVAGDYYELWTPNVTYLRLVRFMRLGKLLRIVRLMHLVRDLRLILSSMLGSVASFTWSMVMLLIVIFMFATLFVEGIEGCLATGCPGLTADHEEVINSSFNSVQAAMVSMFKALTGGDDWGQFYGALEPVGEEYAILYLFFIAFCNFAFMNILTGIFMENAMNLAKPDREAMAFEHHKEEVEHIHNLGELFKEMDRDGKGMLSQREFLDVIRDNEVVQAFFAAQGLDIKDAEMFFKMLKDADHETEDVQIDAFIEGCMRMKGAAKSLDIQALRYRLRGMRKAEAKFFKLMYERTEVLQLDIELLKAQAVAHDRQPNVLRCMAFLMW